MKLVFRVYVLPGGKLPQRQSKEAVGFDAHLRTIVSPTEMDPEHPQLRLTLFNFLDQPQDERVRQHIFSLKDPGTGEWEFVYRLQPGEQVLGGIGIVTELPFPYFMGIWPRSGMLIRHRIDVSNAPGVVDPDYRGEAGVLLENRGSTPFDLRRGMRIAQLIFQPAVIPELDSVTELDALRPTARQADGFGSTGML